MHAKPHAHAHYNSIPMTSCEPTRCSAYSEDLHWRIVWQKLFTILVNLVQLHYHKKSSFYYIAMEFTRMRVVLSINKGDNRVLCGYETPVNTDGIRIFLRTITGPLHGLSNYIFATSHLVYCPQFHTEMT